ncbi:MAG TPA: PspC domain-containing protein [Bryobacteraceae bacterium]|nr:PspC domain-containing protein [Bryobacteraceae bacterium]
MFCTNCGVQLEERDSYCFECGTATSRAKAPQSQKPLFRSISNKKVAGICGGLAEYLNMDSTVVRLLWVVFSLAIPPAGLLGYIIAWIVIPKEPYPVGFTTASVPQT